MLNRKVHGCGDSSDKDEEGTCCTHEDTSPLTGFMVTCLQRKPDNAIRFYDKRGVA